MYSPDLLPAPCLQDPLLIRELGSTREYKFNPTFFHRIDVTDPAFAVIKRDLECNLAIDPGLVHHQVMQEPHDIMVIALEPFYVFIYFIQSIC